MMGSSGRSKRYHDATAIFRQACGNLALGQMVHPQSFTLNDTMACLSIGDARMDSGVDPLPSDLIPQSDRTAQQQQFFNPNTQPFNAQDTLWIMDRLFACQVSYHSGSQLSQTLFTSLHFHTLHEQETTQDEDLWSNALRVYVLAMIKCFDLVWYELTRGNLIEGEDVITDTCQMDMYQHVPMGYVLGQLQNILAAVKVAQCKDQEETECVQGLITRLTLVKHTTMILTLFHEALTPSEDHQDDAVPPAILLQQVHNLCSQSSRLLDKMDPRHAPHTSSTTLRESALKHAPTSHAASSFDPLYARRLDNAGGVPPRPAELPSPCDIVTFWRNHLDSWRQAVGVYAAVVGDGTTHDVSSGAWHAVETLCDTAGVLCEEQPNSPYMRSLWQTCLCPPSNPHPSFLIDFLSTRTHTPRISIQRTLRSRYPSPLQTSLSYWQSKADSLLSSHILNCMSSRPRQKRHLARNFDRWRTFVRETEDLSERCQEDASATVMASVSTQVLQPFKMLAQAQSLTIALTIILSGFDLQLYSLDEYNTAYWLGIQIASECLEVMQEYDQEEDTYLALLLRTLHAWFHLSVLCDVHTNRSTDLRHANFLKRFKWLVLPPPAKDRYADLNSLWHQAEAERGSVTVDSRQLTLELKELLDDVAHLHNLVGNRLAPRANKWHLCRPDAQLLLQRLRFSIQATLQHLSGPETSHTFLTSSGETHPWFPPLGSS